MLAFHIFIKTDLYILILQNLYITISQKGNIFYIFNIFSYFDKEFNQKKCQYFPKRGIC